MIYIEPFDGKRLHTVIYSIWKYAIMRMSVYVCVAPNVAIIKSNQCCDGQHNEITVGVCMRECVRVCASECVQFA